MRNQLLDILRHTWYSSFFEFINFYHIKGSAIQIIPDLYGKVTHIDPRTSQLVTTPEFCPWLEVGMPVRFSTTPDGSTGALTESTLDPSQTYYVNTLWNYNDCIRFTVSETAGSGNSVDLPYSNFDITIIHDRSYIVLEDIEFLDLNMKIVFETYPNTPDDLSASPLTELTKYYVDEFFDGNRIRVNASQSATDFVHFTTEWEGRVECVVDNTFVEAVSLDKKLQMVAQTDEKIIQFHSTFGMDNLGKIWEELANETEYLAASNITVKNVNEDNEFVTTQIDFVSDDNVFRDTYPIIHSTEVPKYHPFTYFADSHWNITIVPQESRIEQYMRMFRTYDEFKFFDLYTNQIDTINSAAPALKQYELEFNFGMDKPKEGHLIFEDSISGTYIPRIIYEFKTVAEPIAYYEGLITGANLPARYICTVDDAEEGIFRVDDTSFLTVGQVVGFENPPDSAQALGQLGLEYQLDYYITEIIDCETFKVGLNPEVAMEPPFDAETIEYDFWLIVQDDALQMEDDLSIPKTGRELVDWIEPGMSVYFVAPPDSSGAILEAELNPYDVYYVKEITFSQPVLRDAVTKIPIPLNRNTGEPIEDILNPDARFPDKVTAPIVTTEERLITRFTISRTPGGEVIQMPFSNFEFFVRHEVNEIHVDDTRWFGYKPNMPIKFTEHNDPGAVAAAGLVADRMYYIHSIVNKNRLKIKNGLGDTDYVEFDHTLLKCLQHHNSGNGLLFTSYPRLPNPASDGNEPKLYSRENVHRYDLDPILQNGPYTFTFGGETITITHDSFIGPYYTNVDDYILGRS
jgi:hypothetical protein